MSKSFIVQARNSSESISSNSAIAFGTGGEIEGDSTNVSARRPVPVALTVSDPAVRISANSLSADVDIEVFKNDAATGCKITILASGNPTGYIKGTGTASFAAGDDIEWRVHGFSGGSISLLLLGAVLDPDTASETVSLLHCNNASSSNQSSNNATWYQRPVGQRSPRSSEDEADFQCPIAGTLSYFYYTFGTVSRTTTSTGRVRVGGVNGNQVITWEGTDDNSKIEDTTNTDSISARDELTYVIETGAGSGEANNLEKLGVSLTNTADKFFNAYADNYRVNQNDGLTRYWAIGGNGTFGGFTTESDSEYEIPFDCTITELFIRVHDENMTDDSTLVIRKNGADVGTAITISGSGGAGYHYQTQSEDFDAGDTITLKLVTGASGTNLRIGYVGVVAEERSGGGPITINLGLSSETDSSFGITSSKGVNLAQGTELSSALSIDIERVLVIPQAQETDSPLGVQLAKIMVVLQGSEVDTGLEVTPVSDTVVAVGLSSEVDAAFATSMQHLVNAGIGQETDSGQGITLSRTMPVGLSAETSSAFNIDIRKIVVLGFAEETSEAFVLSLPQTLAIAQGIETDQAFTITSGGSVIVNQAMETDTAESVLAYKNILLGLSSEVDSAFAALPLNLGSIGVAQETDNAFFVQPVRNANISQAEENDISLAVVSAKNVLLNQALEVDTGFNVAPQIIAGVAVGNAQELDQALAATLQKMVDVGLAQELDFSFNVTFFTETVCGVTMNVKLSEPTMSLLADGITMKVCN